MKYIFKILLCISLFLITTIANADNSLSSLMQRLSSKSAVKMTYKETRTLELMDDTWEGSGYLYSMPPDIMIREQLQPQRLLMAIKGEKIFFFDPHNETRYQDTLDTSSSLGLNITVFKALIMANETLLHELYEVSFSNLTQNWLMELKPKQTLDADLSIIVSGLKNKQADTISFTEDGDITQFSLEKNAEGKKIEVIINQLYQELHGN